MVASLLVAAPLALAAGVGPTSGGSHTVGSTFHISIIASGTTFNAFQGTIKVSGPVSASISPGGASWAPGGTPSVGGTFQGGITSPASSFTIATLSLRGTGVGSGSVSVSGVQLVNNGSVVGTDGGSTSFTIVRAPTVPGVIPVGSSSNPDQNQDYGVTTAVLSWVAPDNGASGYSTVFDQDANTTPPQKANTTELTASYDALAVGVYYFHIRGQNGDGWGPTTTYRIGVTQALDNGLKAPTITRVKKLPSFKTDLAAGTVTGFVVQGSSTGVADFTLSLAVTPGDKLPAEQKLDTLVKADGSWEVVFNQPIPVGFYKLIATAKNEKTTAPASKEAKLEVSVASGGTAKLITSADAPKPDVRVTVAGIRFENPAAYHKALAILAVAMLGFAALSVSLAYFGRQWYKRWRSKRLG